MCALETCLHSTPRHRHPPPSTLTIGGSYKSRLPQNQLLLSPLSLLYLIQHFHPLAPSHLTTPRPCLVICIYILRWYTYGPFFYLHIFELGFVLSLPFSASSSLFTATVCPVTPKRVLCSASLCLAFYLRVREA